jgi:hypothetical protein
MQSAKYLFLFSALCALPLAAQNENKTEAPKNRVFLWGDKPTDVGELTLLFDGQALKGWTPRGGAKFSVENGEIIGATGDGKYGWLITDKRYGDFVLEAEMKNEGGNSGIQIRSAIDNKDTMVGYQIENDPTTRAWSGGLYEQGRRAWLQDVKDHPAGQKAFKKDDWNHYRIEAIGPRIRTWLNGVPITDYVDAIDLSGIIALQVHSGKDVKARWRNIKIKDLGTRKWQPLFDGKTLKGWHPIGKGEWKVQDGVIAGTHSKDEKDYGHLVSDKKYKDFTVRLRYKAVKGNSGFYFRSDEGGNSGISGFQAEIDPQRDSGGLYETNGRSWVVLPEAENVRSWLKKNWFKTDDWNWMTVSAIGDRIAVSLNGHQTAQIKDEKGRREGVFALQLHGAQDVEVAFKDIEILSEATP